MKYAFTNAYLLDGTEEMTLRTGVTVLVEDGIIREVGKGHIPTSFLTIDLGGKFLLPGLIDLHAHLSGTGRPLPFPFSKAGEASWMRERILSSMEDGFIHKGLVKRVRKNLEVKMNAGITTVRSMGDIGWSDIENRRTNYPGPYLICPGIAISVPGGHMAGTVARACRSTEDAVRCAKDAISHGADFIKLMVSGGVLDASDDGEPARLRMPYEMVKAVCEVAHASHLTVAAHAESTESVKVALRGGVDSIEHGALMDEETVALYKQNGSTLTVTISPALAISELPMTLTGMDENQRSAARKVLDGIIRGGVQALEAGIPIGLGTDASCPFVTQYDMWREVVYFSRYCGVSPSAALHTATLGNARILGLGEVTGSIEEGKSADMIVVSHDPLSSLRVLRDVEMVVCRGTLIRRPKVRRIEKIDRALDALL